MKAVVQRVSSASVIVEENCIGKIDQGLLILLGVHQEDTEDDAQWLANKLVKMRIFEDAEGKMNQSVLDVQGDILLVSQFTLYASTKKGNRPSFIEAAGPEKGNALYERMQEILCQALGKPIQTGQFGAMMQVKLVNEGPVTIVIDSKNKV